MRKEFEKLPEIAEIIKEGVFWDGEIYRRTAICKLTHLYYVRGAWYAWQAKAQAVPEGFVLVSKEPTDKTIAHMINTPIEVNHLCDNADIFLSEDEARIAYKAMIEAQEPAK